MVTHGSLFQANAVLSKDFLYLLYPLRAEAVDIEDVDLLLQRRLLRLVGRGAPRETGEAEAIDGFLAARCEAFVGSGASPLSAAVRSLKPWRHDAFELVGPDTSAVRCQRQHRW